MKFTTEAIQKRMDELGEQRVPLSDQRDALWAELSALSAGDTELSVKDARARESTIRDEIKALNAKLAPIDDERANCARALGAKRLLAE
ncbi:MAG: hypothetical protein A3E01_09260 [Gammaproteobacteria bacterium RIFCSPHIGHO2_12_FULL_63_22]|nr:MAG: hypothetical protein A3E01_09260 [Gammaproteobacteria bacterium RIFCSPHIGHO2_12_FULL_63_22]